MEVTGHQEAKVLNVAIMYILHLTYRIMLDLEAELGTEIWMDADTPESSDDKMNL